jgi:hypothetical protein
MPKRNVYVSAELDELINNSESPIPVAALFAEAVMRHLSTKLCPTCGQEVAVLTKRPRIPERPTSKRQTHPTKRPSKKVRIRGARRSQQD